MAALRARVLARIAAEGGGGLGSGSSSAAAPGAGSGGAAAASAFRPLIPEYLARDFQDEERVAARATWTRISCKANSLQIVVVRMYTFY